MEVMFLVIDGAGLMIGSLLCAVLSIVLAWWIGQRMHRFWLAPMLLLAMVTGMLASGLERSLFVRLESVFEVIGMALLLFIAQDKDTPDSRDVPPV